jgi:hypothetical protein
MAAKLELKQGAAAQEQWRKMRARNLSRFGEINVPAAQFFRMTIKRNPKQILTD